MEYSRIIRSMAADALDHCEQISVKFGSKCKKNNFHKGNAFENSTCKMMSILSQPQQVNTLRPRQNGCHFPDEILKWIFLNENIWILMKISLNFVFRVPINNMPTLVQIMAWRRPGGKPLSGPMMVSLLTHICVTQPQWVKEAPGHQQVRHWPSLPRIFQSLHKKC